MNTPTNAMMQINIREKGHQRASSICTTTIVNMWCSVHHFMLHSYWLGSDTVNLTILSQCNIPPLFQSHDHRYGLVSYTLVIFCPGQPWIKPCVAFTEAAHSHSTRPLFNKRYVQHVSLSQAIKHHCYISVFSIRKLNLKWDKQFLPACDLNDNLDWPCPDSTSQLHAILSTHHLGESEWAYFSTTPLSIPYSNQTHFALFIWCTAFSVQAVCCRMLEKDKAHDVSLCFRIHDIEFHTLFDPKDEYSHNCVLLTVCCCRIQVSLFSLMVNFKSCPLNYQNKCHVLSIENTGKVASFNVINWKDKYLI